MWTDFFVAAAGASAALAGLVFVALSVNIDRILQFSSLPSRAASTIGTLMLAMVCSLAALIHQDTATLGLEIVGFTLAAWLMVLWAVWRSHEARRQDQRPWYEAAFVTLLGHAQVLPMIIGGGLLMAGRDVGMQWIAAAAFVVLVCSMWSTWILLVEIRR